MEHCETLTPFLYRWDEHCFPLSGDSLALGEFCTPGRRVLDLGCGAGLLLLLCARREPGAALTGVELDPAAACYARRNLAENGLEGTVLTGDLREVPLPEGFDLVISNPPWYPKGQAGGGQRVEVCPLPDLCGRAASVLRRGGRFALVHRPERLNGVLSALTGAGLEPKRLQLCRARPEKAPYALLVEGVLGGRPGLDILPERIG